MPPLCGNFADRVKLSQGVDPSTAELAYTTPADSTHAASLSLSSSRSISPSIVLVPLDRVQELEAQMAILIHHMQPWMHKSIVENEE